MESVLLPLKYTLCFLTRGDEVLLVHRNRPPNQGLWNGVGGHIEPDETPHQACLREVVEETGYTLPFLTFSGVLTWQGFEIPLGGLYIFHAPAPDGNACANDEGELRWWRREDVFTSPAVVSNIHRFAPLVLGGAEPQLYHFVYNQHTIMNWRILPLPLELAEDKIPPTHGWTIPE